MRYRSDAPSGAFLYKAAHNRLMDHFRMQRPTTAEPADSDEAILARARAGLRRKPRLNRLLAPVAVAASLLLGANLAWNLYQAMPLPGDAAAPPTAALADAVPMSEDARIDHLINHIRTLEGAMFIRKGKEHGPAEAAKHLQYKRANSGERVKTADDFIRLCASRSYLWGDAYLVRLKDGRTRTAEDVLREELARLEGR